MSPEGKGIHPIYERIEHEVEPLVSDQAAEIHGSPEAAAEELFALWHDYRRLGRADNPDSQKLATIKQAIAQRWHNPEVQRIFKIEMDRSIAERLETVEAKTEYSRFKGERDANVAEREGLYRETFQHRDRDPDELTQIRLGELSTEIGGYNQLLDVTEQQSPEFAAQLSFERLKEYRQQLTKDGFVWTPSREDYFRRILDHLVIVNQNRPLLLSGETGTGKTRLARAVAKRLTNRQPFEVGEEAKSDVRPLLGSRAIDAQGSYLHYGQLGQALTGKETSRDTAAGPGGIFYMDEMNGYPPDALRSLIKQISGRRPGEEISFAAWAGQKEKLTPEFGFLASANLPSEKHPDRSDLPVEVARELGEIEIDYPPQTAQNPELYEMMLAGLMDQNGRIRLPAGELAPEYEDIVDTTTNVKRQELKTQPEAGGTLWRFANLVAEVQRSYKGQDNTLTSTERDASYLRAAVLDPGLVLSWLAAYRKSAQREGVDLQTFLGEKLQGWADQKIYPEEDRALLGKFFHQYQLEVPEFPVPTDLSAASSRPSGHTILTPQEIGALSPRVPREAETLKEAPRPIEASAYLADGTEIQYIPDPKNQGSRWSKKGDRTKQSWNVLGIGKGEHQGKVLMESGRGVVLVDQKELQRTWEVASLSFVERFEGKEIKLDALETRRISEKFYKEHSLRDLETNLPKEIRFSPDGEARIREALKMGFDRAMILPATEVQGKSLKTLIENVATTPYAGLSDADQYTNPFFASDAKQAQSRNRPLKAYLLMYQSGPIPPETKGQTPNQLDELFKQKKWNGLTATEHLLLQRRELEERKNHSFDAYSDDATKSQWSWLLDSRVGPSEVANANWFPRLRRVRVFWGGAGYSDPKLGARPAVVVEIL